VNGLISNPRELLLLEPFETGTVVGLAFGLVVVLFGWTVVVFLGCWVALPFGTVFGVVLGSALVVVLVVLLFPIWIVVLTTFGEFEPTLVGILGHQLHGFQNQSLNQFV